MALAAARSGPRPNPEEVAEVHSRAWPSHPEALPNNLREPSFDAKEGERRYPGNNQTKGANK